MKKTREFLFRIMDEIGNVLTKYEDGHVTLQLLSEKKERNLGLISGDTFYVERTDAHIHYKSNSFGFNWIVIKKSSFSYVNLMFNKNVYRIPKDVIAKDGKVLYFKNSQDGNSFELQIFLNRDIIESYLIKKPDSKGNKF